MGKTDCREGKPGTRWVDTRIQQYDQSLRVREVVGKGKPWATARDQGIGCPVEGAESVFPHSFSHEKPASRCPQDGNVGSMWARRFANIRYQRLASFCRVLMKAINIQRSYFLFYTLNQFSRSTEKREKKSETCSPSHRIQSRRLQQDIREPTGIGIRTALTPSR